MFTLSLILSVDPDSAHSPTAHAKESKESLARQVCDNGSLFDLYSRHQKNFDNQTKWRIAKECAMGINAIHQIGYMHRCD